MFQIWRYRTSWEDFHSSTSWLKIFFDIFGRVMVSGVTKYGENLDWHQKVSRQTRVLTWLHDVITTGAWHHDNMTTQRTFPRSWLCLLTVCSMLHIQDIPTRVCGDPRPSPVSAQGQHLQFTLSSQEPVTRRVLHPFHELTIHITHAPSSGQIILFGRSLSLSCPESLMRQNESLTPYLGLILGCLGREGGTVKM